ncbi:MAG: hypothetical protein SFU56_06260 [Capsulimonadales bacterium]|nr:hypothetical protein [Capsulimonadales bacterium]
MRTLTVARPPNRSRALPLVALAVLCLPPLAYGLARLREPVTDFFAHLPTPLGRPLPREFPTDTAGPVLAIFLETCPHRDSETFRRINWLTETLYPRGYTVALVTRDGHARVRPLLRRDNAGNSELKAVFVCDDDTYLYHSLGLGRLPNVVEFSGGRSVWAVPPKEAWWSGLRKRLLAEGLTADPPTSADEKRKRKK